MSEKAKAKTEDYTVVIRGHIGGQWYGEGDPVTLTARQAKHIRHRLKPVADAPAKSKRKAK